MHVVNDEYADFVLKFAAKDGLNCLVKNMAIDEEKNGIIFDLQLDLSSAFNKQFPDATEKDLENTVMWILIESVKKEKGDINDQ